MVDNRLDSEYIENIGIRNKLLDCCRDGLCYYIYSMPFQRHTYRKIVLNRLISIIRR